MNVRVALLVAAVITLHLRVITVETYEVTLGLILGVWYLSLSAKKFPLSFVLVSWLPLITITSLVSLLTSRIVGAEHLTTLALFLFSTLIIGLGVAHDVERTEWLRDMATGVRVSLVIVASYSAAQSALGALDISTLFNPWGSNQYSNQYDPGLQWVFLPRAQGFYLEPSYNAFVCCALAVTLIALGRHRTSALIFGSLGLVASQSAIGFSVAMLIGMIALFRLRLGIALAVLTSLVVAVSLIGPRVVERFASILDTGSSASYRVSQPLPLLTDVLSENPFGMPLGSIYDVVGSYGFEMYGAASTKSLDNGFYVLVYYFGWIGVILVVTMMAWIAHELLFRPRSYEPTWLPALWITSSLGFSGAIMSPEFAFITALAVVSYRSSLSNQRESRDVRTHLVNSDSDVSGLTRT